MHNPFFRSILVAAVFAGGSLPAHAANIVSVSGAPQFGFSLNGVALETSWTQTGTYTNVVIAAPMYGNSTVRVALTYGIGPGTDLAAALAVVPVPGSNSFTYTTLFSGLTLGPGTYYLVASEGLGWFGGGATTVAGSGVSGVSNGFSNSPQAFAPSSTFTNDSFNHYFFTVNGDPVAAPTPEPGTLLLLGAPLAGLLLRRQRTVRASA